MKKVYIRADAGQAIGYGHFVRCLALAAMLRDEFECTIFTQSPSEFQKREASGICPLVALPADDSKFDLFLKYLRGDEIVVLDNYFFTEDYIRAIQSIQSIQSIRPTQPDESLQAPQHSCPQQSAEGNHQNTLSPQQNAEGNPENAISPQQNAEGNPENTLSPQQNAEGNPENTVCAHRIGDGCKVVRIQDFFDEKSCADALIFPCRTPRQALLRPPFLTPFQAPLRTQGQTTSTPRCPQQNAEGNRQNTLSPQQNAEGNRQNPLSPQQNAEGKWVVAFGGSDPLHLTERYLDELSKLGIKAEALRGGLSASEVAELFRSAEGVLCSASSVCYEALACGCKVCAGWYVDNQLDFYNLLSSRGLIVPLGDLRSGHLPAEFDTIIQKITQPADNIATATSAATVNPPTTDIEPPIIGTDPAPSNIADQFRQAPQYYRTLFHSLELEMVGYTDLTPEQSRAVWELRNREDIRRWMTNPEPFSFESHCRFIESLRTRSDREYYAFFKDGLLVGSYDLTNIDTPTGSTPANNSIPASTPANTPANSNTPTGTADSGLFVNPEVQGHGIAKQMAARIDSRALFLGISTLHAVVLETNERSLRFHKSIGYELATPDAKTTTPTLIHLKKLL